MTRRDVPPPHSVSEVAKRLKLLRKVFDKTQAEMAKLAGSDVPQAWGNWETGHTRISLESALRLCNNLSLTLDWIYRGNLSGLSAEWIKEILRAASPDSADPTTAKEIGKRLTLLRTALRQTPVNMAEIIKARQPDTWDKYEQGDRKIDVRHAARLFDAVGVTLDWIYQGKTAGLPPDLGEKLHRLTHETNSKT